MGKFGRHQANIYPVIYRIDRVRANGQCRQWQKYHFVPIDVRVRGDEDRIRHGTSSWFGVVRQRLSDGNKITSQKKSIVVV